MAEAGCDSAAPPDVKDSPTSEDYECKICYNYFDLDRHTPKLLNCSHTFCRECLDALHSREERGWRVSCPVCRNRTPVPEHRVDNLPDNRALTLSLPLNNHEPEDSSNADVERGPAVPSPTSEQDTDSSPTCKRVACVAGSVCAIFCCLSTMVFLVLGFILVNNPFSPTVPFIGSMCLFVSSILALLSIILTWLVCTYNAISWLHS